ncbi:hypothetical protein MPTK1_8g06660 [Marchantia polymorpha subsp. ruderalis]|uniref:Uncharacterized protein n=1 Tax=Marchantia polymorpha TaxID=3197 RepID=A0A2R6XII3_MARPO|nr:hypothetical protein MARPO_0013s0126 [Marchantia polymorpha]BBN18925.1 hypothetical protein Mp_8g06660 [Marchantia polymorpha subsp. ruderalis]|eukprot:PTQ45921.1 hypothetical protein MARPO_0013s0126 [Marchantia polymorpha]
MYLARPRLSPSRGSNFQLVHTQCSKTAIPQGRCKYVPNKIRSSTKLMNTYHESIFNSNILKRLHDWSCLTVLYAM